MIQVIFKEDEIIRLMRAAEVCDCFYLNSIEDYGFHIHLTCSGKLVVMKQEKNIIERVSFQEFLDCSINDKSLFPCGADRYYEFLSF